MSALRKVIIANASPSVTVEVRRGEESHKVSINKRASSNRISSRSSTYADNKLQSSDRRRESINVDETEVPISPSHHTTSRETVKSMVKLRQSPSQPVSERSCRPAISPPPIPPKSEEMSQNGGGLHMQTHEQLAGGLQKGLTRHSGAWEGGAAGAPFTPPHSGSSRGSKWGMSQPGGWATDAPSIGTNGTSPTLSSSSTRCAPAGGEGEGAWESLLGTPAGKRESSGGSGSIEELERGLIASVNELAAQRETANALLLELLALKKKISATARSHLPPLPLTLSLARSSHSPCTPVFCVCVCVLTHHHIAVVPYGLPCFDHSPSPPITPSCREQEHISAQRVGDGGVG